MIFMFLLCVFMLHFRESFPQKKKEKEKTTKKQKKNKWSNCLLRLRRCFFHILLENDDLKLLN